MLQLTADQIGIVAHALFVSRMAEMLLESDAIDVPSDRQAFEGAIAQVLDDGAAKGIESQRLLGMYLLLRVADGVDPFADPTYAAVLRSERLADDDKAHLIQMIRIGELSPTFGRS